MSDPIEFDNLDQVIARLAQNLTPVMRTARYAIAVELQNVIAPYPPKAAPSGRSWYERGYGPRWQRKDGSIGGRKTSETLGRKWAIQDGPQETRLENRASYAGLVHGRRQVAALGRRGWVSAPKGIETVIKGDAIGRIMGDAIGAALRGGSGNE